MKIDVKFRDGPARLYELTIKDKKVLTPNIFFINTKRFPAPSYAELTISQDKKDDLKVNEYFFCPESLPKELQISFFPNAGENYSILPGEKELIDKVVDFREKDIVIISNSSQIFKNPDKLIDYVVYLKNKVDCKKAIYLPAVGNPLNFALLTYLGVDLFDSLQAIVAARNEKLFFQYGLFNKNDLEELPCNCPSCCEYKDKPSRMDLEHLVAHNYYMFINEIKNIRNHIKIGNLRSLVEKRITTDVHLATILRKLDMKYYSFLEKHTPIRSQNFIFAISKETFNRPEIKRFQERIIKRYRKPKSSKILLLLPCSAKKPYSFSQSHRLFKEKLLSCGNPNVIHELIVTSPIGIVPRELEIVYPASSYDIPVTGVWDEDEKKMIRELLKDYLRKNKYEKIISHLPPEIMEFVEDLLCDAIKTCIEKPTSKVSLDRLGKVLKKEVEDFEKIKSDERKLEDIKGLASYQFDREPAEKLLKNSRIIGKYPYQKIIFGKTQLGSIVKERGLISLTIHGAERIVDAKKYWVEIYDDFKLKGSVFAPGIKDCYEDIRIGDDVVIIQNSKVVGVGVATMNGDDMKRSDHGEAVKTRHLMDF